MEPTPQERDIVKGMFDAMQMGPAGEEKMMALFAEDAVMTEPFGGEPQTFNGKAAIRDSFNKLWTGDGPKDLSLSINQIDSDNGKVRVEWTCTSSAFKTPMLGTDYFTIQYGQIKELVMEVTAWPEMAEGHSHA